MHLMTLDFRLEHSIRSGTEARQVVRDPIGSVAGKRVGFVPESRQPRATLGSSGAFEAGDLVQS